MYYYSNFKYSDYSKKKYVRMYNIMHIPSHNKNIIILYTDNKDNVLNGCIYNSYYILQCFTYL